MSKVTLNTEWLSVCGGCHVAIVDLHEKIISILGEVKILHSPVLTDIKDYPHADVGIITGAIRNAHDTHAAIEMRKACDLVIGFGTCAVYGGIPGAGSIYTSKELMDAVYTNNATTPAAAFPHHQIDALETVVRPLDEVIDVDLYLPGCPPHANFIFESLTSLVNGKSPKAANRNVCASCKREMITSDVSAIQNAQMHIANATDCFLSQGQICLGSVTLDRCLAPCPNSGVACTGCAGPSTQVLREPNRDIRTEVAGRMASLTSIPEDALISEIEKGAKNYYAYAMASPMIGQKPTFLIKKWIENVEETP